MRVLLDTHVWLWSLTRPERLSASARSLLEDERNEPLVSMASFWEIAIKSSLGKLALPAPPAEYLTTLRGEMDVEILPIDLPHVAEVTRLKWLHRDPFDRMLVAQARVEHVGLMTGDPRIAAYDVETIAC